MANAFSSTTRSLRTDTAVISWLGWLASGLLLSLWLIWFFFARVTVYETSTQARLEVQNAAHPLTNGVSGSLAKMDIVLSQDVVKGQILLQLDDRAEQLKLAEEQSRRQFLPKQIQALQREIDAQNETLKHSMQSNKAALASARAKLNEAQAGAAIAKDHVERLTPLIGKNYVSKYDWLKSQNEERQAQSAVAAASSEIQRLEAEVHTRADSERVKLEALKQELADLEGQLSMSAASIDRLQQEIEKHKIRSPIDGRVGEIAPEVRIGAFLHDGQWIASIVPKGDFKVVARFLPKDSMGRLHVGQNARFRLDAFPWTQYGILSARVSRVAEEIRDGVQLVDLSVADDNPNIALQHGLTGMVEVAVETTSPAYLVLRSAGRMMARPAKASNSRP